MWLVSGLVLSVVLAGVAWWRSRAATRTFYEGHVYGMGPRAHQGYCLAFAGLAVAMLAAIMWPPLTLPALSVLALVAILYGSTFLRGASGEDE
ncbi:MAG TPA: hypothetical protein VFO29_11735 [Candidatus Rubrimentiphilum sp.]|nr:hypothetical protein [Candidatus Rubrimentiphilum sp.]